MIFSTVRHLSLAICFSLFAIIPYAWSQDGFAEKATGGTGGPTVTVRTAAAFQKHAESPDPCIIRVDADLKIGRVSVASNKTIMGINQSILNGNLLIERGTRNVIIKNLTITNPMNKKGEGGGDGITVRGGKMVWITHCTFHNCADGCVDVTHGSDFVTVSWCKFYYTDQKEHRFTMLAMGREGKKHKNKLKITLHHNWWADNCDQRMPAARKALVHMYNNYFSCEDNAYCSDARGGTELLSEANYYKDVHNPCYGEEGARVNVSDNIYKNCTGRTDDSNREVFDPPYDYDPDPVEKVPDIVRAGAGFQ